VKVFVVGSYSSALGTVCWKASPPSSRTRPFARRVAENHCRGLPEPADIKAPGAAGWTTTVAVSVITESAEFRTERVNVVVVVSGPVGMTMLATFGKEPMPGSMLTLPAGSAV
jgi:hypothetical protein